MNATLSPDTRAFLEDLVAKQGGSSSGNNSIDGQEDGSNDKEFSKKDSTSIYGPGVRRVEVNLTFDSEFFDLLQGNVTNLDRLQAGEQEGITNEILGLSTALTSITQPPSRFHNKTDMYRWREL